MWDGRNLTNGKPIPLAFARAVVTKKPAAQRSSRVPVARAPAVTRPATMPTRLKTVWTRVNVAMLMPKTMGAPFRGKGPNVRGVTLCASRDSNAGPSAPEAADSGGSGYSLCSNWRSHEHSAPTNNNLRVTNPLATVFHLQTGRP